MPDKKKHLLPWSPATYRIEVEGFLEESWSARFAGMRIRSRKRADQSTVTSLTGRLMDQCELTGMLVGLADLHLPILNVENIDEQNGDPSNETRRTQNDIEQPAKKTLCSSL